MRVLRVEDGAGRGMYRISPDGCYVELAGMEATADDRHPVPWNDSKFHRAFEAADFPEDGYVFGFLHEEQLNSWLYDERVRSNLKELGLKLNVYSVPEPRHVIVGYTQLTFKRDEAMLISELDLVTLEPV